MAWRSQISRNLKELRFLYCQTSPASVFTREFVQKNYKDLKTLNPKFPFLIRECSSVEPQLWARYGKENRIDDASDRMASIRSCLPSQARQDDYRIWSGHHDSIPSIVFMSPTIAADMGVERCVRLDGLTEPQIMEKLHELVKAGATA